MCRRQARLWSLCAVLFGRTTSSLFCCRLVSRLCAVHACCLACGPWCAALTLCCLVGPQARCLVAAWWADFLRNTRAALLAALGVLPLRGALQSGHKLAVFWLPRAVDSCSQTSPWTQSHCCISTWGGHICIADWPIVQLAEMGWPHSSSCLQWLAFVTAWAGREQGKAIYFAVIFHAASVTAWAMQGYFFSCNLSRCFCDSVSRGQKAISVAVILILSKNCSKER